MRSDTVIRKLQEHGDRRRVALATVSKELDAITELIPHAQKAGVSLSEIARLAGISRPTLYELMKRR